MRWKPIEEECPEDQLIDTCIIESGQVRMEQRLIKCKGLFWLPDKSMYIYYSPTHWRHL